MSEPASARGARPLSGSQADVGVHAGGSAPTVVASSRIGWAVWPLVVFVALSVVFAVMLFTSDPQRLPSALVGRSMPEITLPAIEALKTTQGDEVPGLAVADFQRGDVSILNVWASWCAPCHEEHPVLTALAAETKAPLYGILYKDEAPKARRFLGRYGNPFVAIGNDIDGRAAIDLGVYGVPETYIVDGSGQIVYKHVGPISEADMQQTLIPIIERTRGASNVAE